MVFEAAIYAAVVVVGAISCFFAVKNLGENSTKKGLRFVLVIASAALLVGGVAGFDYTTNNYLNDEINEAIEGYNLELVEYEETKDYIYVYCYDEAGHYYRDVYLQKDDNGEYIVYVISDNEFVELSPLMAADEEDEEEE